MSQYYTGALFPFTHPLPSSVGQFCGMCQKPVPAAHKVIEWTNDERYPLTTYLCCADFAKVMGPLAARLCARAIEQNS